jgi:predicted phosphodiesterase
MITKVGIISDIHKHPENVKKAVDILAKRNVEAVIVAGDSGKAGPTPASRDYSVEVLKPLTEALSKDRFKTVIVVDGSHETIQGHGHVVYGLSKLFPGRFIDTATQRSPIRIGEQDFITMPGSEFLQGGEYKLTDKHETGPHILTVNDEEIVPVKFDGLNYGGDISPYIAFNDFRHKRDENGRFPKIAGIQHFFNVNDLDSLIENTQNPILISHNPGKYTKEGAVDHTRFHQVREYPITKSEGIKTRDSGIVTAPANLDLGTLSADSFSRDHRLETLAQNKDEEYLVTVGKDYEELAVIPATEDISQSNSVPLGSSEDATNEKAYQIARKLAERGLIPKVYVEMDTNRGYGPLTESCDRNDIRRRIGAHFHPEAGIGHTCNEEPVKQEIFTDDLCLNASHLDEGTFSLLYLRGPEVAYRVLTL